MGFCHFPESPCTVFIKWEFKEPEKHQSRALLELAAPSASWGPAGEEGQPLVFSRGPWRAAPQGPLWGALARGHHILTSTAQRACFEPRAAPPGTSPVLGCPGCLRPMPSLPICWSFSLDLSVGTSWWSPVHFLELSLFVSCILFSARVSRPLFHMSAFFIRWPGSPAAGQSSRNPS